jgi:hypothetical protein
LKFVREYAKFVDLDDTLAMVEEEENGFIVSSRMNREGDDAQRSENDFGINNNFDDLPPF